MIDWDMIAGDLNTKVSSLPIDNVEDKYNELILNINEELLIDLCPQNKFKLTNTKRGWSSITDYIIVNVKLDSNIHVSVLRETNLYRENYLIVGKAKVTS